MPRLLFAIVALAVALPVMARPALADAADDVQFLELLNQERVERGLNELQVWHDLVEDAELHTFDMIGAGDIYHTSDLASIATGWQTLGENVGYGPTVDKLHRAFMNSPSHRANILGDYDRVGVRSERNSAGVLYVTVMFMKSLDPPSEGVELGSDHLVPAIEVSDESGLSAEQVITMAGLVGGLSAASW